MANAATRMMPAKLGKDNLSPGCFCLDSQYTTGTLMTLGMMPKPKLEAAPTNNTLNISSTDTPRPTVIEETHGSGHLFISILRYGKGARRQTDYAPA